MLAYYKVNCPQHGTQYVAHHVLIDQCAQGRVSIRCKKCKLIIADAERRGVEIDLHLYYEPFSPAELEAIHSATH